MTVIAALTKLLRTKCGASLTEQGELGVGGGVGAPQEEKTESTPGREVEVGKSCSWGTVGSLPKLSGPEGSTQARV